MKRGIYTYTFSERMKLLKGTLCLFRVDYQIRKSDKFSLPPMAGNYGGYYIAKGPVSITHHVLRTYQFPEVKVDNLVVNQCVDFAKFTRKERLLFLFGLIQLYVFRFTDTDGTKRVEYRLFDKRDAEATEVVTELSAGVKVERTPLALVTIDVDAIDDDKELTLEKANKLAKSL